MAMSSDSFCLFSERGDVNLVKAVFGATIGSALSPLLDLSSLPTSFFSCVDKWIAFCDAISRMSFWEDSELANDALFLSSYCDAEEMPPANDLFRGETKALFSALYVELHSIARKLMSGESAEQTLQATALVNEAFLKIFKGAEVDYQNPEHFVVLASRAMQRILVDRARAKKRLKRGGDFSRIPLCETYVVMPSSDTDLIDLDEALKELEVVDPSRANLVRLHIFTGLTLAECARTLNTSISTVERSWRFTRAWLLKRITANRGGKKGSSTDG